MIRRYSEIGEGEAIMYRALERIKAARDMRPGSLDYATKAQLSDIAQRALHDFELIHSLATHAKRDLKP